MGQICFILRVRDGHKLQSARATVFWYIIKIMMDDTANYFKFMARTRSALTIMWKQVRKLHIWNQYFQEAST